MGNMYAICFGVNYILMSFFLKRQNVLEAVAKSEKSAR